MENIIGIALIIGGFTLGLYLMWLDINKKKKEKLEEKLRKEKENINKQKEIERKSTAVKAKLEKADVLGNQLSEIQEVEIPDISELKEINSNIISNNMLQAITAYQTWRINKNTKTLRS
jgi:predicted membrane protein